MPQIFHHSTNALAKITIYGAVFIAVALLWVAVELNRSSWNTGQWVERQQPVQFSHKHHVGDDGVDCRYCHTSVETSAFAGMPSTNTCMNCHKQIWADSPYLEPVRASFSSGKPLVASLHRVSESARQFVHSRDHFTAARHCRLRSRK